MIIHLTLCNPELVKGHFINPFTAISPEDQPFSSSSTNNILKAVMLTDSWVMHLNVIILTFCNLGYVNGYLINPLMLR